MAMNGKKLGDDIAAKITAFSIDTSEGAKKPKEQVKELWEDIGKIIVGHIQDNIEIQIPANSVIIQGTGQATGTPNTTPISADVDPS